MAEKRVQKADGSVEVTTADAVDRSRLTVDSLKWYVCKLAPKKYGDKVSAEVSGRKPGEDSLSTLLKSGDFFSSRTPAASRYPALGIHGYMSWNWTVREQVG